MIYRANNNPLVLIEGAADEFLESVGVKLYDDEISIGGEMYDGVDGEEILEENGIFLYEDGIVLEGKQAEEYKAKKAKEKADAEEAEEARLKKSYGMTGHKGGFRMFTPAGHQKMYKGYLEPEQYKGKGNRDDYYRTSEEDYERQKRTKDIFKKEHDKRYDESEKAYNVLSSHRERSRDELKRMHPGVRPTGLFKGKEKREYDNKRAMRDLKARQLDKQEEQLRKKWIDSNKNSDRLNNDKADALRAINRHLRHEEKKYGKKTTVQAKNESTIFSDIEII